MKKIYGPSPYKGGLAGIKRRKREGREYTLREVTNGILCDRPYPERVLDIKMNRKEKESIKLPIHMTPRMKRRRRREMIATLREHWNRR